MEGLCIRALQTSCLILVASCVCVVVDIHFQWITVPYMNLLCNCSPSASARVRSPFRKIWSSKCTRPRLKVRQGFHGILHAQNYLLHVANHNWSFCHISSHSKWPGAERCCTCAAYANSAMQTAASDDTVVGGPSNDLVTIVFASSQGCCKY